MKQKYLILKNDDQKEFIIKEFAELDDKEELLLLAEEKYDVKAVESAIKKGKKALISVLRTEKLYPPSLYANKIAKSVISMSIEKKQSIELLFDDIDLLTKKKKEPESSKDIEKEANEIDELLEDDFKEELDDNLIRKDSLIVEDDKSFDIDE
ncbi:MAG: hypothetical protein KJ976_02945 [Proteobacteria bacterium]|nr:hypothetical protein [Pseudomonadota bacterium]MBU4414050.1 hypothetical protein [Pseudomonadota bacterium]